ncbi:MULTISPECIES: hypothetical protein [Streptomyces]|uniref:hypothetical protein n=1 Tax=Streptomyces TaxID=1883 RepID=UPI00073E06E6|nr:MULTISPECIES: hypothetical protein [unclassified Streptomyces]OYP13207.1 hypothetical protein CFC35_00715 [Streptomyces sp. FBKL.4005]BCM64862.1 hypothetical protein EASAB2608_00196 [Streptomyces sp. EAS-AB2608]CUW32779.1 hypothetical protein TUE45_pSRTUE45c_0147 [Streptomyces reticuli]
MAWEEWEQLKREAAERRSTGMRLNQLSSGGGGGAAQPGGDLTVNQRDLAAIGNKAFDLWAVLGNHGRDAWASSQSAASDLKGQGFSLGGGLDHAQERWERQLTTLLDACAHISNHLEFTKRVHRGDEHYVAGRLSSIATLDQGFREEAGR